MRAAIYARISKDREGAGLGVGRQEADCRAHADRLSWTVTAVYADNDLSAYSGKPRPGYTQLLDALKSGTAEAVVVWHPDRLHRSPRELEDFIDVIEATGAKVATVTAGDYDLSTPDGRLTARIVGSVARKESEDKSRRLRRKHLELAERGKVSGGGASRAFGFEPDRVTVREAEAELIREAARRVLAGETLWAIRRDWTDRGVPTATGSRWSTTTLKSMLCGARVAGMREHKERLYDAEWDAILDEVTWRRVRAVLEDPARSRRSPARSYLLTGLLACSLCGKLMHSAPRGRQRAYACVRVKGGCGRMSILAEPVEEVVGEMVAHRLDSERMTKHQAVDADAAAVEDRQAAERRLAELDDWYADGRLTLADWSRLRGMVERRAEAAGEALAAGPSDALDALDGAAWDGLPFDRKRAVVQALIVRLDVSPRTGPANRFDPDRLADPVWRV